MSLYLHTVKYVPLGGSSYIPLPKFLAAKKAIINLIIEDDECFKWAITRALNAVEKKTLNVLIENFKKYHRPSIEGGLKFPVNLSDINTFENHNSSISVNVIGYEKLVYSLRISKSTTISVRILLIFY